MNETSNPSDPIRDDAAGDGPRTGTEQQERPTPPPPRPRQLRRRTDSEIIGGVAAGIGEYVRVDPVIIRIALVIAAFATGGAAILGYLIAWLIIPDETGKAELGGKRTDAETRGDTPPWVWIALVIGAVIVLGGFGIVGGFGVQRRLSLLVAAGLVGLGIYLMHRDSERQRAAQADGSATVPPPPDPTTGSWRDDEDQPAGTWGSWSNRLGGATRRQAPAPRPPKPARPPRSPIARITLGLAVGAIALMSALQMGNATQVPLVAWTAVPLAVIGGGLVLGSLRGGARGLIGWGVTAAIALALTLGGITFFPSVQDDVTGATMMAIGSLTERPETAADLVSDYGVAIGEVVLDLRELDAQDLGGRTLRVSAGIGEVVLIVPADVPVVLTGAVGIGESDVLGQERGGMPVRVDLADPRSAEGPVLTLDLRAGIGAVRVERATAR